MQQTLVVERFTRTKNACRQYVPAARAGEQLFNNQYEHLHQWRVWKHLTASGNHLSAGNLEFKPQRSGCFAVGVR